VLVGPEGARLLDDAAGAGPVLGVPDRRPYREADVVLVPGTTLLLYTDGLVERRGEHLDLGLDRLTAAAGRLAGTEPAALTRELLGEVLADAAQPDDVAVLAVRLLPPPLYERLPADPNRLARVRRAVAAWARAGGLPEEMSEDLQLALGEALANAVEHAYPGAAEGECAWSLERDPDGAVRACVQDFGVWRPPPADRGHRGRGLELISALGADVDVRRTQDGDAEGTGTTVRFRIPAPRTAAVPSRERRSRAGTPEDDVAARLDVAEHDGTLRLAVRGSLDLSSAGLLGAKLRAELAAVARGRAVVVDLTQTTYLASAGVGLLVELSGSLSERGIGMRLVTDRGSVPARILALTGVDAVIPTSSEAQPGGPPGYAVVPNG
jgi:anti-anti-sigma factor